LHWWQPEVENTGRGADKTLEGQETPGSKRESGWGRRVTASRKMSHMGIGAGEHQCGYPGWSVEDREGQGPDHGYSGELRCWRRKNRLRRAVVGTKEKVKGKKAEIVRGRFDTKGPGHRSGSAASKSGYRKRTRRELVRPPETGSNRRLLAGGRR